MQCIVISWEAERTRRPHNHQERSILVLDNQQSVPYGELSCDFQKFNQVAHIPQSHFAGIQATPPAIAVEKPPGLFSALCCRFTSIAMRKATMNLMVAMMRFPPPTGHDLFGAGQILSRSSLGDKATWSLQEGNAEHCKGCWPRCKISHQPTFAKLGPVAEV